MAVDKLRHLKMEGLIPQKIKCPSCGIESDTISVKEESLLYWNGSNWEWSERDNAIVVYYCDECGEELPDTDELEVIVESAQ